MAALTKRSSPPTSIISPSESTPITQSFPSPTSYLLATASSCPSLTTTIATATTTSTIISSTSPSPDDTAPKIVRSASVKSCASDSGVSSSSPLSDNNIVHVSIYRKEDKKYHFFLNISKRTEIIQKKTFFSSIFFLKCKINLLIIIY
jgi:hypothetical protein